MARSHRSTLRRPGARLRVSTLAQDRTSAEPEDARLALLGSFGLWSDGLPVPLPGHAQRLVAFLALHDRPLHRAYVAGCLWLDVGQDQAHNRLRSTLWRMRALSLPVVDVTPTHLAVRQGVSVDVRLLEESVDLVVHGTPPSVDAVDCLVRSRDLLVDWYDDWIVEERDRLRQIRLLALETACVELVSAGRSSDALRAGMAAVAADPLRESASRALIAAYASAGNLAEAVRRFEGFRDDLAATMQLDPSPQMLELVRTFAPGRA